MTIWNPSAAQIRDISDILDALNGADNSIEKRSCPNDLGFGDGTRALIRGPIPVYTDANGENEVLGWIQQADLSWEFTQQEPKG